MNTASTTSSTLDDSSSKFAIFFIFASLTYQLILCFTNTHIFGVGKGTIILVEFLLIVIGFTFFFRRIHQGLMLFVIFLFVNTLFLSLFKEYLDPKSIRDFLIPVLALWLGMNYNHKIEADKIVKYSAYLVIAVGLFEAVFVDLYQSLFNVANFQVAIGTINETALRYKDDALSLNGIRYGGRNFLASILGNHRISSVFLETVNMGNFSTILACWGLSKEKTLKSGMLLFLILAIIVAVLADSRFGITLIAGLVALRFLLPTNYLKLIAYFAPLIITAITLAIYFHGYVTFTDDFKGRLGFTGYNLTHFSIAEYFGLSNLNKHFGDSGYSQTLFSNGIVMWILVWVLLCRFKTKNETGVIYLSLLSIFISAILAVSGTSIFAMKVSVLMWFLAGVLLKKEA